MSEIISEAELRELLHAEWDEALDDVEGVDDGEWRRNGDVWHWWPRPENTEPQP